MVFPSLVRVAIVGSMASVVLGGCGLRSEPLAMDTDASDLESTDADVGGPAGSCSDPIDLPFMESATARGRLEGSGRLEGWCGGDEGPEHVYRFVAPTTTDVTISFLPEDTDFRPVLRVQESGCDGDERTTIVCDTTPIKGSDAQPRSFLAEADTEYSIIVDSPIDTSGDYAFSVSFEPPPIAVCGVHDEVILQIPGNTFRWNNEFSRGQGRVDGSCGGPGKENMFTVAASYAGFMFIDVAGSRGMEPVVSVRTGCGGTTELDCAGGGQGRAELGFFIPQAGTYYIVIDQATIDGGAYDLEVFLE
jgi:hypothetical protein